MRSTVWRRALALAGVALILSTTAVFAAVSTDQSDYAPGSVVTISGDNSDGAGYLPGETVLVDVSGPNGYEASCQAVADGEGAWSCQVTLWDSLDAVGSYDYTAAGLDSGVTDSGTFTDAINVGSFASDCSTPSASFVTGATVCAKAAGIPGPTPGQSGKIEWWAPGAFSATRTTDFGPVVGNVTDSFAPSVCGTWTLKVYVPSTTFKDDATFDVTGCVTNTAPVIDNLGTFSGPEGSDIALTASAHDPDNDPITYSWTVDTTGGDSGIACQITDTDHSDAAASVNCNDDSNAATFKVTLSVSDDHGHTTSKDTTLTVTNVAPTVTGASFDYQVQSCGANSSLTVTFTDPGSNDTWKVDINWGDGTSTLGADIESGDSFDHSYSTTGGPYTPSVVVTDDDAGASAAFNASNSVYVGYQSDGILQPINLTGSRSLFKYGSTIPVKLQLKDCAGNLVLGSPTLKIRVQKLSSDTPSGVDEVITSAGQANTDSLFRYDSTAMQYIYNLSTKTLTSDPTSSWRIFVDVVLASGPPEVIQLGMTTADFGLRK